MTLETEGGVSTRDARALLAARGRVAATDAWRGLRKAPASAWVGLVVIGIYLLVAMLAPIIAPYGQAQVVGNQYEAWSARFLFGTDQLGRDMLTRLIYGARNTVGIAIVTTMLSFLLGGALGLLAAVLGGWID